MSSLKLLVVEDDVLNLELMEEVLTSLKAQVLPSRVAASTWTDVAVPIPRGEVHPCRSRGGDEHDRRLSTVNSAMRRTIAAAPPHQRAALCALVPQRRATSADAARGSAA